MVQLSSDKSTMLPLVWMPPWQFVPEVSFTLCNKVILPPLRCASEPDSVTQRQMTRTIACGPAAITNNGPCACFLKKN